jgi:hypothetical protein
VAAAIRADAEPWPEAARPYRQPALGRLVAICWHLQRQTAPRDFWLACRDAGRELGVSHRRAARWLWRLRFDGVIAATEEGGPWSMKATRYRFRTG